MCKRECDDTSDCHVSHSRSAAPGPGPGNHAFFRRLCIFLQFTVCVTHSQHVSGRLSNESLAERLKSGKESG